jgi:hypothetical protein
VERLGALQQIALPPPEDAAAHRRQALIAMTLDLGVRLEQTYIAWLDACLTTLAAMEEPIVPVDGVGDAGTSGA